MALEPSFDAAEVWADLELTGEAHDSLGRHSPPALGALRDPRPNLEIAAKGGVLGGVELFQVGEALQVMRSLKAFLEGRRQDMPKLAAYAIALPDRRRLEEQLRDGLEPDGTVKDSASPALGSLRSRKKTAIQRIQERIQAYISGRNRELLSDPIYTIRDGRYVLPLKAENRGKLRGIVHDTSATGQTLFIEPEDVLQMGNALREIEAAERTEVQRLLILWSGQVGDIAPEAITGIEAASAVDFVLAKARLAYDQKGAAPQSTSEPFAIEVQGGRHPLLDPKVVVPLDIKVGRGHSVLITGPNTGGKTVAIKCVGLFVLMAQSGLFLPALDVKFSPFSQVWADIGDEQSLEQSLSTFSGHIKNIAEALRRLTPGALVLLDEAGAGTDPAEGASLAKAVLSTLNERGAAVLASTHYGELKAFAFNSPGFTNAAMEFDPKSLRPTYRLLMGAPGASQALRIAERYGMPRSVVDEAREGLGSQAADLAAMAERLEAAQRQARIAQGEADRRISELRKTEQRAERQLAEAEEVRRTAHAKANEVIEAALREIRLEASRLFEELKSSPRDQRAVERVREELRNLDQIGREFAEEFLPRPKRSTTAVLERGVTVRIEGFSQPGTVIEEPKNGQVGVQVGMVKIKVPLERVKEIPSSTPPPKGRPGGAIGLRKALAANTEIHLRHMRAEEAVRELEKFMDDAVLAGVPSVRIVHGKGEGRLRKATQDFLRHYEPVASFRDGEPAEGGQGVTIATFK